MKTIVFGVLLTLSTAAAAQEAVEWRYIDGLEGLTEFEQSWGSQMFARLPCSDAECIEGFLEPFERAINTRRKFVGAHWSDEVLRRAAQQCVTAELTVFEADQCWAEKSRLSFDEAMAEVGLVRAGVTRRGYYLLRTRMRFREVEFILGDDYERLSYAGGHGHSASLYRWGSMTSGITVGFTDDEVLSYSQYGLR